MEGIIKEGNDVVKKAEDVFGDSTAAREWLTHPQPGLGNAKPVDFAAGAQSKSQSNCW